MIWIYLLCLLVSLVVFLFLLLLPLLPMQFGRIVNVIFFSSLLLLLMLLLLTLLLCMRICVCVFFLRNISYRFLFKSMNVVQEWWDAIEPTPNSNKWTIKNDIIKRNAQISTIGVATNTIIFRNWICARFCFSLSCERVFHSGPFDENSFYTNTNKRKLRHFSLGLRISQNVHCHLFSPANWMCWWLFHLDLFSILVWHNRLILYFCHSIGGFRCIFTLYTHCVTRKMLLPIGSDPNIALD